MIFKLLDIITRQLNKRTFLFNREPLHYFFHSYNNFGYKSRCIEIPIIRWYLDNHPHDRCLEIGNVGSYYYEMFNTIPRTVVDRDERVYDTIQMDIKDYLGSRTKFDFIFSISTFEHMGMEAWGNLMHVYYDLLKPGGLLVITFPYGEIDMGFAPSCSYYFMERVNEMTWRQTSKPGWRETICIMEIRK